jgi:hypothetical protein
MDNKTVAGIIIALAALIALIGYLSTLRRGSSSSSPSVVENFPQSVPMNVMYSDANGNLGTTTDLGLKNLTVSSDTSIGGGVSISGASNLASSLNVGGDAKLASTLSVTGASNLASVNVGGALSINGSSKLGSTLDVTGASKLASTLEVSGASKLSSTLEVSGVLTSTNAGVSLNGADITGPTANTRINSQGIIFGGTNNGRDANSAQISAGRHDPDALCIVGMSKPDGTARRVHMWSEGGTTHEGPMTINGSLRIGNIVLSDAGDGTLMITGTPGGITIKDSANDNKFSLKTTARGEGYQYGGQNLGIYNKHNAPIVRFHQGGWGSSADAGTESVDFFKRQDGPANNPNSGDVRSYQRMLNDMWSAGGGGCGTGWPHAGCNIAHRRGPFG